MVFQSHSGVDVEKTVTDTQFKIATNSKLFSILSDSIYTRKIDAVIRELCCNAFDAQVEAKQSRPFQVTLPDEFTQEFRVRDFGLGLCEEDMQMYTTYGESTKSRSNAYIGAFGIGAKSPFAYTNTFNVTSYHGGMARSYSMFVEQGVPRMTVLGEAPSEEPTGLEVFFSVASKDIDEFRDRMICTCSFMADKLEVLNVPDVWREQFRLEIAKYQWEPAPYIGSGYMTSNLKIDSYDYGEKQDILNIVQGNVAYKMSMHEILEMLKFSLGSDYRKLESRVNRDFYITGNLKVPNGTFVPHPSRERLTFDELTKASIKNIFQRIFKYHVTDAVDKVLTNVESYYDLHTRLKAYSKLIADNPRIKDFDCDDMPKYMIDARIAPIKNYADWQKAQFPCVSLVKVGDKEDNTFRFKSIPQMIMKGEFIDRIYHSSKYPISEDYRLRIISDKLKSEAKNVIILTGNISRMFSPRDVKTFVDVQSLPKLTPEELAIFKRKAAGSIASERVKKEQMSFLKISSDGLRSISQATAGEIIDITAEYPVYWVESNRRYEFQMTNCVYKLKTQISLSNFYRDIEFFFDYHKKQKGMAPKANFTIGVAVLPENHELKGLLPSLFDELRTAVKETVTDFLGKNFYEIRNDDLLFKLLVDNYPDLLTSLLKGSAIDEENILHKWFSEGKPQFIENVKTWNMPFGLLPDGEMLRKSYRSFRNVHRINVANIFSYMADSGYSILRHYRFGCTSNEEAKDLVFYLQEKSKQLVLKNKDGN